MPVSSDNFHGHYKIGAPYEIEGDWYYPKEQPDYDEVGISSWYGPTFHGKKTANGDTFDQHALTAAHNTLPLPSMVRVTNLENQKTLILMINDRGPFAKGRVIDVSERAASILGFKDKGIAKVRVQFLKGQTQRLLSDLPKDQDDKSDTKKKFSFFENTPDDLNEEEDFAPLDIMSKADERVVTPIKNLSKMIASKIAPKTVDLPEINIAKAPEALKYSENSDWSNPDEGNIIDRSIDRMDVEPSIPEYTENEYGNFKTWEAQDIEQAEGFAMETPEEIIKKMEGHFIQAGTYGMRGNAKRVEKKLRPLGEVEINELAVNGRTLYRVRIGPIMDKDTAERALNKVIKLGHADALIISELVSIQ